MEITIKQFNEILEKVVITQEAMEKLWTKVETLNERTKKHTREISDLRKEI